ncbi:MAG TPA: cupin domain-containing protein [Novosphingobium sp.]
MPKLDLHKIPQTNSTGYPPEHAGAVVGRWVRRLSPASGLTDFGASQVVLKPGAWSSQRHWHDSEDEFLVMISGEALLIEDEGRTILKPGDVCAWPKGIVNGHHIRNDSEADCSFVVIGGGERTGGGYSDIDMIFTADGRYLRKDGTPY